MTEETTRRKITMIHDFNLPRMARDEDADDGVLLLVWPEVHRGALPQEIATMVQGARFDPAEDEIAVARYCRMMAECEYRNDLWADMDTVMRDRMFEACVTYVGMYFAVLDDCMRPRTDDPADPMHWWGHYAAHLFWSGRTGAGLVRRFAGMEEGGFRKYQSDTYSLLDPMREVIQ